ncbi:hypothetical protein [Actinocorallia lasiicapitis]
MVLLSQGGAVVFALANPGLWFLQAHATPRTEPDAATAAMVVVSIAVLAVGFGVRVFRDPARPVDLWTASGAVAAVVTAFGCLAASGNGSGPGAFLLNLMAAGGAGVALSGWYRRARAHERRN